MSYALRHLIIDATVVAVVGGSVAGDGIADAGGTDGNAVVVSNGGVAGDRVVAR